MFVSAGRERNEARRWCVFDGVVQDIGQCLGQARRICVKKHRLIRDDQPQFLFRAVDSRLAHFKGRVDQLPNIRCLLLQ